MKNLRLWLQLSRAHYTPVIILPVILGTLLALYHENSFNSLYFFIALTGSFFAHIGANTINDYFDYKSGVDDIAESRDSHDFGGAAVLTHKLMNPQKALYGALVMFAVAFTCGFILAFIKGYILVVLAVMGFLLGFFYVAPPIKFGYFGRGVGEIAIFFAFGPMPVAGAYYVQTGHLSAVALWGSIPLALYTVSILYNHHFTHFRGDKAREKMSPVVVLGEIKARIIAWILLIAGYLFIIINVLLKIYPVWACISLVSLPPVLKSFLSLKKTNDTTAYMQVTESVVKGNILTGVILNLSILLIVLLNNAAH